MKDQIFRLLCEQFPYPLSIHNREGIILWANKAFADMVGMDLEEIQGSHCFQIVHHLEAFPSYCP
ncbi:MAG TPA: PAS domain S-box protein, partial [Thermodesulfatator sp.]|nr:PAS domain S-box protein [Thermodesulfatator sp.]